MAKRHPSLATLSRDHHHGLSLALKLRQGPKALLSDGWTHDPVRQARRVLRFAEEELAPHFAAEEEVLFPFVRARVPELVPLVERLIGDHRMMEALTAQLAGADGPPPGLLERIGGLLERHIRAEERDLFPACELLGAELEEIGHAVGTVREREVRRRHRALYAEARVLINAPTGAIFSVLLDVDGYASWWPRAVVFSRTGETLGVEGTRLTVSVHGRSISIILSEIQHDRFIEFGTLPGDSRGSMRWEVTDAKGGRLVRWELNMDWEGEGLMDAHLILAQAAHEAVAALAGLVAGASPQSPAQTAGSSES